jgi:hypothetical protein
MAIESTYIRSNKAEAELIKSKLKLRFNTDTQIWELYTTMHGTKVFRWFKINQSTKDWYHHYFPHIPTVKYDPKEK